MAAENYEYYEGQQRAMGTLFKLHAFHLPGRGQWIRELADRLFDSIVEDDRRLSIYVADSLINRINRSAGKEPVECDRDTFALLKSACGYWETTGGLFDITAGVLMRAWGFYSDSALPEAGIPALEEIRPLIGCDKLELDPARRTARLAREGMLLDLGGFAKGWCVQRRSEILSRTGLEDFVISAGTSTVLARGSPPGEEGWPSELEIINNQEKAESSLILKDCAVSVSANYRNTVTSPQGITVRHIMNPLTLEPVQEIRRVVVVGPDAAECEALSTAYLIQGALSGYFTVENRPDISVHFNLH
jgi:thiamine biosynthesis lipoprotein